MYWRKLGIMVLSLLMVLNLSPLFTIKASATVADGTYDFGGAITPQGGGFQKVGNFLVPVGFAQEGTTLWSENQQAANSTGDFTLKASGTSTFHTFTFKDFGISNYEPGGFYLEYLRIRLYDINNTLLETYTSPGDFLHLLTGSVTQLSSLINGGTPFAVDNVASLRFEWKYSNTRAPSNMNLENITIANAKGIAEFPQTTASFDKYTGSANNKDVSVPVTLNGNTVTSIKNGSSSLIAGTDYSISSNTLTIRKSYLAAQPVGTTTLNITFSSGSASLTINISDTTPKNITDFSSNSKTRTTAIFTWTPAVGATSIKIEQSLRGQNNWSLASSGTIATGANTATVSGLAPNTEYDFRLVVTGGENAGNSNSVTVKTDPLANLSNLTLSEGTLSPAFAPETTSYTVSVGNAVKSVDVVATVEDASATPVIISASNGSEMGAGGATKVWLSVGVTTVTVVVAGALDGTRKTYTVTITRAASSNADLSSLTLSEGTLSPVFASGTTSYTASVGNAVTALDVTAAAADATATVTINGRGTGTAGSILNVPLSVSDNLVSVVVTAQDGTPKTYTVTITRAASSNANLSNLTLSEGTLSPVFASGTTSYTASVGNAVTAVDVTATIADATASVTINGTAGSALNVPLTVGENTLTVVVTAQDGSTNTYTITITRAASSNADLSSLTLSEGTLSPVFASGITSYTASVGNAVTAVDVTATIADATASVTINGTAGSTLNVPLTVGANTVTVLVTAGDGTPKTYTVTITRTASSNANLSNLTLSEGALSPVFASGTTSYTASVGNAVTAVDAIATIADTTASVTINGTAGSTLNVPLTVGVNTVTVLVTAEDGTPKTYTITITRAASSNADLSSLTLSDGTLSPVFASGTTSYTASVGNAVTAVDVIAVVADATASVGINGTAGNTLNVPLSVGANAVTVLVTAEDGTPKTYTVTITRAASSNADLSSLTLSEGTLSPVFASGTTSYSANVGNAVTAVDVIAAVADATASVGINGTAGNTLNVPLSVGANTVTILVTAEDGTPKTYTITITRAASSNADLSSLTLSEGTLSPVFASGTTSYTASVVNAVTAVDVTAAVADATASVGINGTAGSTLNVPLSVGANTVTVLVTAEDGTPKTYTIMITRAASSNADLSSLTLSEGTLSPVFASGTTSYTASVGNAVTAVDVIATIADVTASVTINGTAGSTLNVPLTVGPNPVTVIVTAQNGTTKTYTVTITRTASSNANLSNLTLSEGALSPAFASGTTSYTASVGNAVNAVDVIAAVADAAASVTINGTLGSTVNVPLTVGANTVTVVVTAQDGSTKTYTITITRAASSNADLSNLTLSEGALSPVFTSGTTSYTASVGNAATAVDVTATIADATATVSINGTAGSTLNVPLSVGSNTVTVAVTAQDGTTKTYTITITRAASSNADLSSLTLSDGTLSPVFASGTTSYTASVGNVVTAVDVTATIADVTASVTINGTAGSTLNVPLSVGANTVTIVVTAQDGTPKTYTVTIPRAASSNADLSSLTLSDGTLSPVFASGTTSYTASVGNAVTAVDVTTTIADVTASVGINGTAGSTLNVPLSVGANTVTVVVTAQDGTPKTYTVTITRAASSNADLSNLTLSEGVLSPVFASGTTSYTASVGNEVSSVDVTASVADATATVAINGTTGSTLNVPLTFGANTVTVVVTAQDGTPKSYTITITRAASSNADLSNLTLSEGALSPVFASGTTSYTANVGNAVTTVDVTASVADATASVAINGTAGNTLNVPLTVGAANTVTVVVTAQDGSTKTYTITITRAASSNADLSSLTLSEGTLSPVFASGTTSYTASAGNAVTAVEVTAGVADATASVAINGTAGSTVNVPLSAGANTVTIVVTAQDGTPKTYMITIHRVPGAPAHVTAAYYNAQATLAWELASGVDNYHIFMGTESGNVTNEIATLSGTTNSYHVTGLTNGTTYYFIVKASNQGGISDASNEVSATPISAPAAPTGVTAEARNRSAVISFVAPANDGGSPITGYIVTASPGTVVAYGTASPITITGLTNGTQYTFRVQAVSRAGISEYSSASNVVTPRNSSGSSGNNADQPAVPANPVSPAAPGTPANTDPSATLGNSGANVLVNGKAESAGTAATTEVNGQSLTKVTIDEEKLEQRLKAEGSNVVITIPVVTGSDIVVGEMNGRMVKSMENQHAVIELKTNHAAYALPANEVNIDAISAQLGASLALEDITIHIEIANPSDDTVKVTEDAAQSGGFTLVVPPLNFKVRAEHGAQTVEVNKFNVYIERTLAIPEGIDPNRITTGVVVEPDGTVRHVPTKIVMMDGKYFAKISSLSNSTYSVVWHPLEFTDTASHWAKDAINDMGSRMVISGVGNRMFQPDQDITRAEFAAIIVRGLGLKLEKGASPYSDVHTSDWYSQSVLTAHQFNLINGFEDSAFRPNDKITREQAMVILSKAMAMTGMKMNLSMMTPNEQLEAFADGSSASEWAKQAIARSVQAGIITGREGAGLAPKAFITRAEVAVIVKRLLQQSELI